MRSFVSRALSAHYLESRRRALFLLVAVALLLEIAAAAGLSFIAGFHQVVLALGHFQWQWLLAVVAGLLISFIGYYYAYRGIFKVEHGPTLQPRQMGAVVAAGFGGFLAHGGGALDQYALEAAGDDVDDAKARVSGLAGLEHGVLAIGGCIAAIVVLAAGAGRPPADFTIPWAVLPIPGFLLGFWVAERYRGRYEGKPGWRGKFGTFLTSIHLVRELFMHPGRWGSAIAGMALFWAADAFATWAGLATFGFRMNAATLYVGFATGMVFTRRTGPLGGAGVLALVMPLTIWVSGAPLAVAIVGVFAYRILALCLPLPVSLMVLSTLRDMGEHRTGEAAGIASQQKEPALRRSPG